MDQLTSRLLARLLAAFSYTASLTLSLTVTGAALHALTPPTAPVTVAQGFRPVSVTVAFGGYSSPVTFTCTGAGEPDRVHLYCASQLQPRRWGRSAFHLTTTAPSFASNQGSGPGRASLLRGIVAGATRDHVHCRLAPAPARRGLRMIGLIMVLGVSTMWLASCGGSGGGTKPPPECGDTQGQLHRQSPPAPASGNVTSSGTFTR